MRYRLSYVMNEELKIDFPEEWFNDSFYPLLQDDSRILALKGGGSSSKSHSLAQKWVIRSMSERNLRVPLVRKVKNSIRVSQYQLLLDHINRSNLSQFFDIRDTDMKITCRATGSTFFALGMDDEQKVKSLTEPNGMWINEPTELTYKDWLQMVTRLRGSAVEGVKYKQITVDFNPIDEAHWIKKELFPEQADQRLMELMEWRMKLRKKKPNTWFRFSLDDVSVKITKEIKVADELVKFNIRLHHSNHFDNRFLDPIDRAWLEDMINKDKNYHDIYCLGKWGNLGNLVFNPMWKIKDRFPESFDDEFYGLDFGYNHPSALVKIGIKDGDYYVRELLYEKKLTKPKLLEMILEEKMIDNPDAEIYADSAEPDTIDLFCQAGLNVTPSIKGNESVKNGLDHMKSLKIYTHKENYNLNRELRTYKWKEDPKTGDPIEGVPVKLKDDAICATRYGIFTHSRGTEVKIGFVRKAV